VRSRGRETLGLHARQMKRDSVSNLSLDVGTALGCRHTPWYVGGVGGEAAFRFLNYDEVFHRDPLI